MAKNDMEDLFAELQATSSAAGAPIQDAFSAALERARALPPAPPPRDEELSAALEAVDPGLRARMPGALDLPLAHSIPEESEGAVIPGTPFMGGVIPPTAGQILDAKRREHYRQQLNAEIEAAFAPTAAKNEAVKAAVEKLGNAGVPTGEIERLYTPPPSGLSAPAAPLREAAPTPFARAFDYFKEKKGLSFSAAWAAAALATGQWKPGTVGDSAVAPILDAYVKQGGTSALTDFDLAHLTRLANAWDAFRKRKVSAREAAEKVAKAKAEAEKAAAAKAEAEKPKPPTREEIEAQLQQMELLLKQTQIARNLSEMDANSPVNLERLVGVQAALAQIRNADTKAAQEWTKQGQELAKNAAMMAKQYLLDPVKYAKFKEMLDEEVVTKGAKDWKQLADPAFQGAYLALQASGSGRGSTAKGVGVTRYNPTTGETIKTELIAGKLQWVRYDKSGKRLGPVEGGK